LLGLAKAGTVDFFHYASKHTVGFTKAHTVLTGFRRHGCCLNTAVCLYCLVCCCTYYCTACLPECWAAGGYQGVWCSCKQQQQPGQLGRVGTASPSGTLSGSALSYTAGTQQGRTCSSSSSKLQQWQLGNMAMLSGCLVARQQPCPASWFV
jgi:hypothetical protein